MNVEEFDTALSDLETRVDRLRALYENWFRGYEKTEPGVARKDVERRVYGLRKELPRNTALRFRYHQLYQRYTTLATYWQRTARQIEEGTYRLQLQRIKRRRDDDTARTLAPPPRAQRESSAPPAAYELNLDETLDVRNLLDELDLEQVASALDVPAPQPSQPPVGRASGTIAAFTRAQNSIPARGSVADVSVTEAARPASARFGRPSAESLGRVAGQVGRAGDRPSIPDNDVTPQPASVEPVARVVPAPPPSPVSASSDKRPPPPPPTPPGAQGKGTGSVPLPATGRGTGAIPLPPPPSRGTGTVPLPPRADRPPAPPLPAARPAPAGPAPAGLAPSRPGIASAPGPSEQRMRSLYQEYAAARKRNNEGDVRYEALAGSIQKMLPDLLKRHAGKKIDFEVVVKDGRVGLKPKAI